MREAAGERFDELEMNIYPSTVAPSITDHALSEAAEAASRLNARGGPQISADALLESPHIFVGSVESLSQKFIELRERLGLSSVMLGGIDDLAPIVERLAGT